MWVDDMPEDSAKASVLKTQLGESSRTLEKLVGLKRGIMGFFHGGYQPTLPMIS